MSRSQFTSILKEIYNFQDLLEGPTLMSFSQLIQKNNISKQDFFHSHSSLRTFYCVHKAYDTRKHGNKTQCRDHRWGVGNRPGHVLKPWMSLTELKQFNWKPYPSKTHWHRVILEYVSLDFLTCRLHGKKNAFHKIWEPFLMNIDLDNSAVLTRGVV